jgi:uncharacterized membrane protein YfcA|tara:strand:+ start:3137 stop:3901 length:765 start_codon:yes stop_codon:yes gene_type:complete
MTHLANLISLTISEVVILATICLIAGVVRGFSGFALSALVMASAALIIPPIQLIPICWWLEMTASLFMFRSVWQEANRKIAVGLAIGSTLGMPFGLALTMAIATELSKLLALGVIIALAALQLARVRIPFSVRNWGLYGSGWVAGVVSGVAGVGGMVVALFILSQKAQPRQMRASLVLFLFLSSVTTIISLWYFGVMDQVAIKRGLVMALPAGLGVVLGKLLFMPKWEYLYKPFCLTLLIVLAITGIIRVILNT